MGGVIGGPEHSGPEQNSRTSAASAAPNGSGSATRTATAQEFGPLAPMPFLLDPDAVFVARASTPELLAAAGIAYSSGRLARWSTGAAILTVVCLFLASLWGTIGAGIGVAVCALLWLRMPGRKRRLARSEAFWQTLSGAGTVMATRFGPESFDVQIGDGHHRRVRYADITRLRVDERTVLFTQDDLLHAYPRELFPQDVIDLLAVVADGVPDQATLPRPPLPPIPPLERPTATFVVRPGTALRIAERLERQRTQGLRTLLLVVAVPYLPLLWYLRGWTALGIAAAVLVLLVPARMLHARYTVRRVTAELERDMPPGTRMATRFGPDAFDIHIGPRRTRFRYDWLTNVAVLDGVVRIDSTLWQSYPRELFPPRALAYLDAMRPRPERTRRERN
ncbi:hypothetical protein ACWDOP_27965 [Nocardia sp. NPDC003693]